MQAHFRTKVGSSLPRGCFPILFCFVFILILEVDFACSIQQVHKRRLKALELEPYSIEESERAAGQGNFKSAEKRILETQPSKAEYKAGKRVKVEKVTNNEMVVEDQ